MLPLVTRTAKALAAWLAPDEGLELRPDLDAIEALAPEREALWSRLEAASFLSTSEMRAAAGYGEGEGADAKGGFNPAQPRDEAGRWSDGGDFVSQIQDRPGPPLVDLLEEEAAGGHTIARHVGKTDEFLLRRIRTERGTIGIFTIGTKRAGSFPSVAAANKLVNATLAHHSEVVAAVAAGSVPDSFLTAVFSSPTGREAFASGPRSEPTIRDTYGVGVLIVHDPRSSRRFRILTAYPRND